MNRRYALALLSTQVLCVLSTVCHGAEASADPTGFFGVLRGEVTSADQAGKSFSMKVSATEEHAKKNKMPEPGSLVGTEQSVRANWDPAFVENSKKWIASLQKGDSVVVHGIYDGKRSTFAINAGAYIVGPGRDEGKIVILGDSITNGWEITDETFPGRQVVTRALSGASATGLQDILKESALALKPKALVILAGTNDLLSQKPEASAGNVLALVKTAREADTSMPVFICAVMPQDPGRVLVEKVKATNDILKKACGEMESCHWVDTFTPLAKEDGTYKSEFFRDKVHPNAKGYALWQQALAPELDSVLK